MHHLQQQQQHQQSQCYYYYEETPTSGVEIEEMRRDLIVYDEENDSCGDSDENEEEESSSSSFLQMAPSLSIKKPKNRWSKEEDECLNRFCEQCGPGSKDWKIIATHFRNPVRTEYQCQQRWQKVLNPDLIKGRFWVT